MEMVERWKTIGEVASYEVSDQGRIRRIDTGHVKQLTRHPAGHFVVNLSDQGRSRVRSVHNLVASAFHRTRKSHEVVLFIDGNRSNCCAANLRIVPRSRNVAGAYDNTNRLEPADVRKIRVLLEHGTPGKVIAHAFGVSETCVSLIKSGKNWHGGERHQQEAQPPERTS